VEQIAAGVSDRFRLLTGGPRTAVARQRTLRASVDWSYELLASDERVLLRRLAVFAGGFALDAVENVCAGDGIAPENVLDLLGSLVDQSLVVSEERVGGMRYRLLETVRQYSRERLTEAGEADALRARHCEACLAFAEEAAAHLESAEHRAWLGRLDPEAANLAAAIEHALASEPSLALRFCIALERWWNARGRFVEAELALVRSLEASAHRERALRGRALVARTALAVGLGDYGRAQAHATEALALADSLGDVRTAARARGHIGLARQIASPRGARADLGRAAELARTAGDDWAFVAAKQWTACSYLFEFEHARAARANDEVAALAERVGDPAHVGRRWLWNVWMAVHDGRLSEARDAADRARPPGRALEARRRSGSPSTASRRSRLCRGRPSRRSSVWVPSLKPQSRSAPDLWCRICSKGSPRPSWQPVDSRLPAAGSRPCCRSCADATASSPGVRSACLLRHNACQATEPPKPRRGRRRPRASGSATAFSARSQA